MTQRKGISSFQGSRAHYAPSLSFTINHMRLEIEPHLQRHMISCEQRLSIVTLQDTDTIELDAAELQIKLVSAAGRLDFRNLDDKLAVKLGRTLKEGSKIQLYISYAAKPRRVSTLSVLIRTIPRSIGRHGHREKPLKQGIGFLASITLGSSFQAKFRL